MNNYNFIILLIETQFILLDWDWDRFRDCAARNIDSLLSEHAARYPYT